MLTNSQRVGIIEARTLAKARTRAELIDALSLAGCDMIAGVPAEELADIPIANLHATAFGMLSAMAEELASVAEDLNDQLAQATELLAERTDRGADYWASLVIGLAANARRPRPSEIPHHERCATCQREAHYPGSAGNHGHPYQAPAASRS